MAIEDGQKLHFGPLRIQLARRAGIAGVLFGLGAARAFYEHSQVLAWPLLILTILCALFVESSLVRYVRFTDDGYVTHGYQVGLIPRTREGTFKDIQSVSATSGPVSNTQCILILRKDGRHRLLASVSSPKVAASSSQTSTRFERLLDEIRSAIGEGSE